MLTFLLFIGGFAALTGGAEWLVKGASRLARGVGVTPLAIGLTIVAYGTGTPELMVNIKSALIGKSDIALGNIIGSNIFNLAVVLGLSAMMRPLKVGLKFIKFDVPIMIAASLLLYVFCLDLRLSRLEGLVFLGLVVIYTFYCFKLSKREPDDVRDEFEKEFGGDMLELRRPKSIALNLFFIVAGLFLLGLGAQWLVTAAVTIARILGISELVIALTIIAAGTSLPELATSVMATIKGERDIAIGNVVGSNIFNILAILGVSAVIPKSGMAINFKAMMVDFPFMIFVAVLLFPFVRSGRTISRREGLFLFLLYVGYTVYLIMRG